MTTTAKRFVILALLLLGWQASFAAQHIAYHNNTRHTLEHTRDNRPQWDDLGMDNVLAVGQPSVSAPTVVRVVHENASPLSRIVAMSRCIFPTAPVRVLIPRCAQPGYLYLLLCLRL